jgi:hypothetical protein
MFIDFINLYFKTIIIKITTISNIHLFFLYFIIIVIKLYKMGK